MTAHIEPPGGWTDRRARLALRTMLDAAIASADPARILAAHLPPPPEGRCVVVGAGKAAASMAVALEAAWPDVPLSGVVVTPYGYGMATRRIVVREAAHPVPDANSEAAAREILAAVSGLTPDDLVVVLISGGGSSVMALPAEGLTLADKQAVNRALLSSGLDIRTMNIVRRRLSAIKGGKLAEAAAPARVLTLGISDIPGDDVASIASGPSVPDPHADTDLEEVVRVLGAGLPEAAVRRLLQRPTRPPTPVRQEFRLIGTPAAALEAAAAAARREGITPLILGDDLEGESRQLGADLAAMAMRPVDRPTVLLSGGETTVTLTGGPTGRGGRNTEFMLSFACAVDGHPAIWALSADTDGEDGANGGAAGAVTAPDTLARARTAGLDPSAHLAGHDSGSFFAKLGDLLVTGPTRTNVNDFRAILILPQGGTS
ncbi:glycerate kinase type-2 family protein [Sphingomonas oligoaromativorans]|uniref:glycerate kinase type-2 family protein n=1 Tax=Sphingomonas oligoaromativorans TaxID=575322 RepID=UPI001423052C|nr:glycerate kinase [Sphingomonas oligoaromativorans]NIJ35073.1 hydroxypyruvate reductase [Sphingomonas oligoaromativorans]